MRACWPAAARAEAEETTARPPAAFAVGNLVANRALTNRARSAFCSTLLLSVVSLSGVRVTY